MKKYNPATDFQKVLDTRLAGRLKTDYRWVSFWFGKESPIQTLIHELKYNYRPRIGSWLGDNLGNMITVTPGLPDFHLIPVPVHPLKKIERGYNQAELIAASMVNCLPGCQMIPDLVVKKSQTSSQTKLDRWTRFMNSKDTLELNLNHPILKLQNPHFLLVDDIITTGSTLENMGKLLQTALPQATFSVAAIALTE